MSESQSGKKLVGLARSIDALFSTASTDAPDPTDVPESEDSAGVPPPSPAPEPQLPVTPSQAGADDADFAAALGVEGESDGSDAAATGDPADPGLVDPLAAEGAFPPPPVSPEPEAPIAPDSGHSDGDDVSTGTGGEASPDLEPDDPAAGLAGMDPIAFDLGEEDAAPTMPPPLPDNFAADSVPALRPDDEVAPDTGMGGDDVGLGAEPRDGVTDGDSEEAVPTALEITVGEFLEGEASADEIEGLAAEMVERREIDPVASAVLRLMLAAGDPPDARIHATAQAMMSPVVLGRLARRMGGERDEERRAEYFHVCRIIGDDMAAAIKGDLAESTDRLARRVHCEALVAMGPVGRKVIEEMVMDDNRFLVRNAVAILGEAGGDRAVELVTTALANPDARVRREALRALAKLGDESSGELVVGMLEDSDPDVRIAAAVAAGELGVERAVRPVTRMLEESKDPDEVLPLVRALGHLGDPGAVQSIEKHAVRSLFSRPRADVRITSYRALAQIGTPHARRLLNQALDDKDPEVKAAVKEILHLR